MKSILAIAAAAAAVSFGASAASAQECQNGYFMLKDSIPISCGGGANGLGDINGNADEIPLGAGQGTLLGGTLFGGEEAAVVPTEGGANAPGNADEIATAGQAPGGVVVEEPVYTGSIAAAEVPVDAGGNADQIPSSTMQFVASRDDCRPGYWYLQEMQSQNFPARCP